MQATLKDASLACIPAQALASLVDLRNVADILVGRTDDEIWVRWQQGDARVALTLLAVSGARLFVETEAGNVLVGTRLSAACAEPAAEMQPLCQVLTPAPFQVGPPTFLASKASLELVRDTRPRAATALECSAAAFARWSAAASRARLGALQAACCRGRLLILGRNLPLIVDGDRFWGESVLAPLGWRVKPELEEDLIRAVCGVVADEVLVIRESRFEAVPRAAFATPSKAALAGYLETSQE